MGTSESGHTIVLDANAGTLAPSPLESVLISLGSCSSVDVVSILEKARQNVRGCKVEIEASVLIVCQNYFLIFIYISLLKVQILVPSMLSVQ